MGHPEAAGLPGWETIVGEFLQACVSPVNLVLSVLLGLCLLYWILVVFGFLATETFDLDADLDADVDADADLDLETDVDADADVDMDTDAEVAGHGGGIGGAGLAVLRFMNVGDAPLMVVLTVLVLVMWIISVSAYEWIGGWSLLLQFAMLVPVFLVAAALTKLLTQPVKHIFRRMREEERAQQHLDLLGKMCRVVSNEATESYGQAEFATDGAPLLLNVRLSEGAAALNRGDEAVIVSHDRNRNVYIIRAF